MGSVELFCMPHRDVAIHPDSAAATSSHIDEMLATAELLADADEIGEVLERLTTRAMEVTGADYTAVALFDDEGGVERFIQRGMTESEMQVMGHPPVGRGLLGELARRSRPLRLDNLKLHSTFTGWPEGHPDMGAFLGVPIKTGKRNAGSLYMTRIDGEPPFTERDELAAWVLAVQGGQHFWNVLSQQARGRMWLLEERERIAHDLHDGTIQTLYALGLQFDTLASSDGLAPEVAQELAQGVDRINDLIGQIRQYIIILEAENPPAGPDLPRDLAFVARQLVPEGVDTVLNITAPSLHELTARQGEDFLYIAREALSNAVRHGDPTKIAIDLRQNDQGTALTIQDNGVGFEPSAVRPGLGTITMRTRAARLGGQLSILGIPGMGTTIRVTVPREEP